MTSRFLDPVSLLSRKLINPILSCAVPPNTVSGVWRGLADFNSDYLLFQYNVNIADIDSDILSIIICIITPHSKSNFVNCFREKFQ